MANPFLKLVEAVAKGEVSEDKANEELKGLRRAARRNRTWAYAKVRNKSRVSPKRTHFSLGHAQLNWDKLGD
jgi:hypothetical protein